MLNPSHFWRERESNAHNTSIKIRCSQEAVSCRAAARSLPSPRVSWNEYRGALRAINRWREWYKMSQCTFPNKNVSALLQKGNGPKYLKKLLHFPFSELLLYFIRESLSLPRYLTFFALSPQSPISHRWLGGSFCSILHVTQGGQALFLFRQGQCVRTRCWLSIGREERKNGGPRRHFLWLLMSEPDREQE